MIDALLRGAPGGPPGDLVLLMNVSALATRGPPGGPPGGPGGGISPRRTVFFPTRFFFHSGLGLLEHRILLSSRIFLPSGCL